MQKIYSRILTVYFIFLLSSCDSINFESTPSHADTQTPAAEERQVVQESYVNSFKEFEDQLTIQVEPEPTPYKYRVLLNWKKFSENRKFRIKNGVNITETDQSVGYFVFSVAHDQKIQFSFDLLDKERRIEYSFLKHVEIPRDFVLSSENKILNNGTLFQGVSYYKINRLFLNAQDTLIISESNAVIEINNLFADENSESIISNNLYTSNSQAKASLNQNGRDGGHLQFLIKNLRGRVHFIMYGESGGNGSNGEAWSNRARDGQNGTAGTCSVAFVGEFSKIIKRPCDFNVENQSYKTNQSDQTQIQKENSKSENKKILICPGFCACDDRGTVPTAGANGEKGRNGLDGKTGGASGDLDVSIEKIIRSKPVNPDDHQLTNELVKMTLINGKKGNKGIGSPGQDGGIGGTNISGKCTTKGAEKQNGSQGPKGDDGVDGKDGIIGHKCLSIPSEGVNYCE